MLFEIVPVLTNVSRQSNCENGPLVVCSDSDLEMYKKLYLVDIFNDCYCLLYFEILET